MRLSWAIRPHSGMAKLYLEPGGYSKKMIRILFILNSCSAKRPELKKTETQAKDTKPLVYTCMDWLAGLTNVLTCPISEI